MIEVKIAHVDAKEGKRTELYFAHVHDRGAEGSVSLYVDDPKVMHAHMQPKMGLADFVPAKLDPAGRPTHGGGWLMMTLARAFAALAAGDSVTRGHRTAGVLRAVSLGGDADGLLEEDAA